MVHLVTGYAGYEHIQSEDDGAFNAAFFGDGQFVMEMGSQFAAAIIDNNTVRISDGEGMMHGRHFRIKPKTYEDATITTGSAGVNRIDLICITYIKNEEDGTETTYLEVIKGTEGSSPAVPTYTPGNILNGAVFNQMPLYKVTINGIVLTKIEPLFTTQPTYKALAEKYAKKFQAEVDAYSSEVEAAKTAAANAQKTADGKSDSGHSHKKADITDFSHTHTKSEISDFDHSHTKSDITDFPDSMKNPNALTIQFNGTTKATYDGSGAKTVNVTPAGIGAATEAQGTKADDAYTNINNLITDIKYIKYVTSLPSSPDSNTLYLVKK